MKRTCLLVLAVLVCVPLLNAQQRSWSIGPLRWDLLKKNADGADDANHLVFDWSFSERTVKPAWNTWMTCLMPDTKIDLGASWHNAALVNPTELAYDQVLFDIQEWMFRQCVSDYYSPDIGKSLDELMREYQDEADRMSKQVIWDTDQGRKPEMVDLYSTQLKNNLENCPVPRPDISLGDWSFSVPMGVSLSRFIGDTGACFGATYGAFTVLDFGYKKHQFQAILDFSGGSLVKDYSRKKKWYAGDSFIVPTFGVDYGYSVYDGSTFRLAPFVGLSSQWLVLDHSISQSNPGEKEKMEYEGIWNPSFIAGFTGEFKYLRVFNCFPEIENPNGALYEAGLGLHAYVSRSIPGVGLDALSYHLGITVMVLRIRRMR